MSSLKDAFVTGYRCHADEIAARIEATTGLYSSLSNIISGYASDITNNVLNVVVRNYITIVLRFWSFRGISIVNCGIGRCGDTCEFYINSSTLRYQIMFPPNDPPTDEKILSEIDISKHEIVRQAIAGVAKKYVEACDPAECTTCF